MPNQDQTGPNGQGPATGKGQGSRQDIGQAATEQDNSMFGMLRRQLRAGQQGQGQGKGRGRGAGSCDRRGR